MAEGSGDEPGWKRWAESFRLWMPVLISCCAIFLTIYQANAMRRHNRLAVRPKLDWRIEEDGKGLFTLSLINVGLGPAIVTEVSIEHDGEALGSVDDPACAALDARLGRAGDAWDTACITLSDDLYLRQGDEVVLYGSRPSGDQITGSGDLPPVDADKFWVRARYCSFYDECWWLGRK